MSSSQFSTTTHRAMNMVQNAVLDHSGVVTKKTVGARPFTRKDLKHNLEQLSQEERKDLVHLIRSNCNTKDWKGVSSWKDVSVLNPNPHTVSIHQSETCVLSKLKKEGELYQKVFTHQKKTEEKKEAGSWTQRLPDIAKIATSLWNRIFGISTKELIKEMQNLVHSPSDTYYNKEQICRDAHSYVDHLYNQENKKISASLALYNRSSSTFNPNNGYKQWISHSAEYLQNITENHDFVHAVKSARYSDISHCEGDELSHLKAMRKKLEVDIKHSKIDLTIGMKLLNEVNKSIDALETMDLSKCQSNENYKNACIEKLITCQNNMEKLEIEIDAYIEKLKTYQQNVASEKKQGFDLYIETYQECTSI